MPMIKQSRCGCRRAIGVRLTLKIVEATLTRTIKARPPVKKMQPLIYRQPSRETAFDRPRDFLGNRFVYAVISARAGGLSLGVNMNPDKLCNFDCSYCDVDRHVPSNESRLAVDVMAAELHRTLLS